MTPLLSPQQEPPKTPQSNGKILLVAQYCLEDMPEMMGLLALIRDIEKCRNPLADLLVYSRSDCRFHDQSVLASLDRAFDKVIIGKSVRPISGWPFGPNAMAIDLFRKLHKEWQEGRFEYESAMLIEPDCVPLATDWIRQLSDEWKSKKGNFLGYWEGSGKTIKPPISHMNGNLLFHPRAFDGIPEIYEDEVPVWGWDMAYWWRIAPVASPSRLIWSDYRLNTKQNPLVDCRDLWKPRFHTFPDNPLCGQELHPVWLHGTKGFKAQECVRQVLCK